MEPIASSATSTSHTRARKVPWSKLVVLIYSFSLLWQFVGNILYTVRVVECSADEKLESFGCNNITTFGSSKELELTWYILRFIHMTLTVLALQKVPHFPGYVAILRKLKSLPEFWTLLFLLLLGIIRYFVLIVWSEDLMNILLILSFVICCILKLVILGIINYCQLSFVAQQYPTFVLAFSKITLIVILLQGINDFCLAILQLAFRADDLNNFKAGNSENIRIVAGLFRKSAEC